MKKNDDKTSWGFDPSSDDEFMKTIEQVLQEEEQEQQQRINISRNDDIQWIDISEPKKDENIKDENIKDENIKDENIKDENIKDEKESEPVKTSEQTDEFAVFEEAVHNIANMEELYENIEQEDTVPDEETIVNEITDSLSKQVDTTLQTTQEMVVKKNKKKVLKRILIPFASVLAAFLLVFVFLRYTKPGKTLLIKMGASYASSQMDYQDGSNQEEVYVPDITDAPEDLIGVPEMKEDENKEEITADTSKTSVARHEDYAVNILLLGEEAIDSGTSRGRTDVMMIATINTKEKAIKLTSLMRDMYVQIPGHLDNKLNSVYATGGIPLLYETIELNFNLKLDGYCLVGFNSFEKIIDLMGGVDIKLTGGEADYLNSTNYISNPEYRNVAEGWNHMNGNQALGYCRIRKVATMDKQNNDFGRTSRNRIVLDSIFSKYKSLDFLDLAIVMNSCLPMITTDLDASEIENYLSMALEVGLNELQQCRIPANGAFEDATVRKMLVIVPNLQKNIEILHTFIFGDMK